MTLSLKRLGLASAIALLAVALSLPTVFAGEEKPAGAAPATETPAADAPATPSPIHSMMAWVGSQVTGSKGSMCPSTKEGEAAWRGWFAGGKDVPLAGLRDQFVKDGWNADRLVAFFQEMAKSHGKCGEGEACDGCPSKKGEASGATAAPAAAADAPKSGEGCKDCPSKGACKEKKGDCCGKCPSDGDCSKCECKKGKPEAPKDEAKPAETTQP